MLIVGIRIRLQILLMDPTENTNLADFLMLRKKVEFLPVIRIRIFQENGSLSLFYINFYKAFYVRFKNI